MTVISYRIARAISWSGAAGATALNIIYPRLLTRFVTLVFYTNSILMEFQVYFVGFFSSFLSYRRLRVVSNGKS